ncbi:MAG: nickel pincer cofactor biosynthesis protein LarC [Coriobacteriales bacterium]|jgi:uncharacterized protein (TIGR00299 family) protein|nr:nickel pincer cofactor biosynthesis protein LarC [Coriobacteriales bacterium]
MILHLELSTGASGDKLLGALLEVCETLGTASLDSLCALGSALLPRATIRRERVVRGGVAATFLTVEEPDAQARHWDEIQDMITGAEADGALSATAAQRALAAFEALARAESEIHGVPVNRVHFHEVGAADSIIDMVGTSCLLDSLAPEAVHATPLALGSGTVFCAHGVLPVPAPATARLIEGLVVCAGSFEGELTTPTGAALVKANVTSFDPLPTAKVCALGHGAGSRELDGGSNVVRAIAAVPAATQTAADADADSGTAARAGLTLEGCMLLESNIDHLSPEALAHACDVLLARNALDVWQEPIHMKKGRLAVRLCVLCAPADAARLTHDIVAQTGTLGVRRRLVERVVTERRVVVLQTTYGQVPFKMARLGAVDEGYVAPWLRPEHDAVNALAREHGHAYQDLYEDLTAQGLKALGLGIKRP